MSLTSPTNTYRRWPANSADSENPRPAKRARVALACQRCKTRKQKCDGNHPSCGKCKALNVQCVFIIPQKPMPFGKNHYLKTLEKRVVELEGFLLKEGLLDQVQDHRQYLPQSANSVISDEGKTPVNIERRNTVASIGLGSNSSDNDDLYEWQSQVNSMVDVLRDLSLDANGGYIGASSHITMGKLVSSIARGREYLQTGSEDFPDPDYAPFRHEEAYGDFDFSDVPTEVADRLIIGYMKHIATRWPILHSGWIRDLHSRRNKITDVYEKSTLHLIYATGGRFLETTGEVGNYAPGRHHSTALESLDEILKFHDTRSVVTLMLLAIASLRGPRGPGAWMYVGLAMRIAIDLGLHRQTSAMKRLGFNAEMKKRLFWSCYSLDRQVSIPLGRPFSISDRDIDVDLPLDVDEAARDLSSLEKASKVDPSVVPTTSTSLSSFLHVLRLRRIESNIQQSVYRVDQSSAVPDSEIDYFIDHLAQWKKMIPLDTRKKVDCESVAFDGYDYYMVFYYKCLRLLLYPQISKPKVNPRFLKACAEACGGVCQSYKRLHQALAVGYSLMALQTVFMAGLTLVYCIWISPGEVFNSSTSNDINACSIVLFVITERWPGARKYRDAFEVVKHNVVDMIAEGKNQQPRQVIEVLKSGLGSTLQPVEMGEDGLKFARIVTDMAGEQIDHEKIPESMPAQFIDDQTSFQSGSMFTARSRNDFTDHGGYDGQIMAGFEMVDEEASSANIDFSSGFDLESYLASTSEDFRLHN